MNVSKPILTIAIPTHNGSNTISNMLELLLPQITKEIEVIVVDNCSDDGTGDIVKKYATQYPFLSYIRNEKNIGPDANFLKCFRICRTKYLWNVSDDDIVIEGAVDKVLSFLNTNPEMGLVHLETVDFRGHYNKVDDCQVHKPELNKSICTKDKKEFFEFAGYYWGFLSSFIANIEKFKEINNPEKYFGSYWLQGYLFASCARGETYLGVIKGPCVGAGIYVNNPNFDSSLVNGVYYKRMLEFMAAECGFDKKQLLQSFNKRICHLSRHDILKEKSAGIRKINRKQLFKITYRNPVAWLTVYPLYLIPDTFCIRAMNYYRHKKGLSQEIGINRPE